MPSKPKLTADKLDCLHCGDIQDITVIEELFEKTGNSSAVTMYCKSCNGKLIARFSVNGFYSFHRFNPELKIRYDLKQKLKRQNESNKTTH
jgi:hypothetical protein